MSIKKGMTQYTKPFWLPSLGDGVSGQRLVRKQFSQVGENDEKYDEDWLQRLLYRFPDSLPIEEIEPVFGKVISVGREMPTPAGPVDNVYVTPEGNIILVECKLWRNPEARRRVISQIIDYAQSISSWSYSDFDAAIKKSLGADGNPIGLSLIELVSQDDSAGITENDEFDEARFIDAVQKNLRMGRLLLLVVGDGIREDTERLAEFLQIHAGFHFTLGMIEVAIFQTPDKGFIVQPRVLARTLNIERAIVRLISSNIEAVQPLANSEGAVTPRSMSMTEEIFFEKLRVSSPSVASELERFLIKAKDLGVFLDPATKSAGLKWESGGGKLFNLGGINLDGNLVSFSVCWAPNNFGRIDIGHDYLEGLSKIINGDVRKTKDPAQWYVVKNGLAYPSGMDILSKADDWLKLISWYQNKLNEAGG